MAENQIHPRASRFSKIMRALQPKTQGLGIYLTDIDGVRSEDLFGRAMMLIEQRTNGFKSDVGPYTRDAVRAFAEALSLQHATSPKFNSELDEDTQQRLWLQYSTKTLGETRFRLIAVVDNYYEQDVAMEHRRFAGLSKLPREWAKLTAACAKVDVYSRAVRLRDGALDKGDEVLLCAPIARMGREAMFR